MVRYRYGKWAKVSWVGPALLFGLYLVVVVSLAWLFSSSASGQEWDEMDLPIDPDVILAHMEVEPPPLGEADAPRFPDDPPPPSLYGEDFPSEESVTYVLDRSGSMNAGVHGGWVGSDGVPQFGSRLDRAKQELSISVAALSPNFDFNVYAYSCPHVDRVFPGPVPADPTNKGVAIGWVQGLVASGGTGTAQAVLEAISGGEEEHVILLSDGRPGCGLPVASHLALIVSAAAGQVKVSTVGIGDTSSSGAAFLQDVAAQTGGTYVSTD